MFTNHTYTMYAINRRYDYTIDIIPHLLTCVWDNTRVPMETQNHWPFSVPNHPFCEVDCDLCLPPTGDPPK